MLFSAQILTADKKIFEGDVYSLVVPAALGYLGILANHAPLIASLKPGKITFKDSSGSQKEITSQGKGFIEVEKNKAIIFLDAA